MQKGRLPWNIPRITCCTLPWAILVQTGPKAGFQPFSPILSRPAIFPIRKQRGIIFANIVLAYVTQPLIGYYSDRASLPYLVPLGVFLCGFSLSAMAFTQNYWFILFLAMLSGLGSSLFHPEAARLCKRHFRRPKRQGDGDFFCRGQCRLCRRSRGSRVQRLSVWHQGAHHLRRSQFSYGSLSDEETSCNQKKTQRDRKKGMPFKRTSAENDWNAFGKLSFVIFARSIGFTILNSFIPIYWISVLGTSASSGSLALSLLFSMGVVMTFWAVSWQTKWDTSRSCGYPSSSWSPPSSFSQTVPAKRQQPCSWCRRLFPFLRLTVPWSSWDRPTLPATLVLLPA